MPVPERFRMGGRITENALQDPMGESGKFCRGLRICPMVPAGAATLW